MEIDGKKVASICSAYIMCYIMLSKYGEKFMNLFKF